MTSDEHAIRRTCIGSSEMPTLLLGPQWADDGGAWEIYHRKIGTPLPEKTSAAMTAGTILEPAIAQLYTTRTGKELSKPAHYRSKHYPWLGCSIDFLTEEDTIVECKYSQDWSEWGADGTDEIPPKYIVQVQHQMAARGLNLANVAALVCGELKVYFVPRNQQLVSCIIKAGREFWERVEQRRPPEPDWSLTRTGRIMELLYPAKPKTIELPEQAAALWQEYEEAGQQEKAFDARKTAARNLLRSLLGDAQRGRVSDGRVISRSGQRLTIKG